MKWRVPECQTKRYSKEDMDRVFATTLSGTLIEQGVDGGSR